MRVWGVVWGGTRSDARDHAASFLRTVGRPDAADGGLVVLGPEFRNHDHVSPHLVPELLVDDVGEALAVLPPEVEVLGLPKLDRDGGWVHVRVADGRVYGLTSGCAACRCMGSCDPS